VREKHTRRRPLFDPRVSENQYLDAEMHLSDYWTLVGSESVAVEPEEAGQNDP